MLYMARIKISAAANFRPPNPRPKIAENKYVLKICWFTVSCEQVPFNHETAHATVHGYHYELHFPVYLDSMGHTPSVSIVSMVTKSIVMQSDQQMRFWWFRYWKVKTFSYLLMWTGSPVVTTQKRFRWKGLRAGPLKTAHFLKSFLTVFLKPENIESIHFLKAWNERVNLIARSKMDIKYHIWSLANKSYFLNWSLKQLSVFVRLGMPFLHVLS